MAKKKRQSVSLEWVLEDIARAQIQRVPPHEVALRDAEQLVPERMAAMVVDDPFVDRMLMMGYFGAAALRVMRVAACARIDMGLRQEEAWADEYRGYDYHNDVLMHQGDRAED